MNDAPLRVLIVDDEPMARARLRRMLCAEHGVDILGECSSGEEAAAAFGSMKPDVVFLDIQMPGMDGFGTLHRASVDWRPQVVFVTAFSEHAVDAFEHGLSTACSSRTRASGCESRWNVPEQAADARPRKRSTATPSASPCP